MLAGSIFSGSHFAVEVFQGRGYANLQSFQYSLAILLFFIVVSNLFMALSLNLLCRRTKKHVMTSLDLV
jgi:hypothetical protein